MSWFSKLKAGDMAYIRKPWFDKIHRGGELHRAIVTAVFPDGLVFVEGHGVFHPASHHANFNTVIERPTPELLAEYTAQHASRLTAPRKRARRAKAALRCSK